MIGSDRRRDRTTGFDEDSIRTEVVACTLPYSNQYYNKSSKYVVLVIMYTVYKITLTIARMNTMAILLYHIDVRARVRWLDAVPVAGSVQVTNW